MRIGLNIPSSSSSSSAWHVCTPWMPPDSASSPGPLPPFSRPQELVLCRLLEVDPGSASLSAWFFLRMSLCLCKMTHVNSLQLSHRMSVSTLHPIPHWWPCVLPWRAGSGGRNAAWSWCACWPLRRTACGGWGWEAHPPSQPEEAPDLWTPS